MAGIEVKRRTSNVRRAQIGAAAMALLLSLAAAGWTPAAAAAEHRRPMEQDRRGHRRRLGRVPDRGIRLHVLPQTAVYDALVAIDGTYESFGPAIAAPRAHHGTRRSSRPPTRRSSTTSRGSRPPWRGAHQLARRDRRRAGQDRRHRGRPSGRDEHHRAADRRRPADADRLTSPFPTKTPGRVSGG